MSNALVNLVKPIQLEPSQKLVLWVLADAARDPDDKRYPSQAWPPINGKDRQLGLVQLTGLSERTIQRSIQELRRLGHLTRNQVRHGVIYTVHPLTPVTVSGDIVSGDQATPDNLAATPATTPPKPLGNVNSQKASPSSKRVRSITRFQPPADVSKPQWDAFCQQRKKSLTDRAYQLICDKLVNLAEAGHQPGDMIDLATERGWETVFPPRAGTTPLKVNGTVIPADPDAQRTYWIERAEAAELRADTAENTGRFDDVARADARTYRARAAAVGERKRPHWDRPSGWVEG